ncbi:MAG: hypothetical protein RR253_00535 [Oscillospiraceae bacterium]
MKKLFLSLGTLLCTALIAISIYHMTSAPAKSIAQDTKIVYIVKDYGGKIAVFAPEEEEPMVVYDVYTHLLPENDIELLRKGITATDDFELLKTLEDFGL